MNIAFAGFRHGHIFDLWNKAVNNTDIKISGAWEDNEEARNAAFKSHGIDFNYKSYEEILNDGNVDIVAIGDYYGKRGFLAIEALKAGKHVIADKPLCISLDELDMIEKISKEKKLCVSCMYSMRYGATAVILKEIVKSGRLGTVHSIFFSGQHPLMYGTRPSWYFEDGKHGGVINDIAVHGIDFIKYTLKLKTKTVIAAREWNAFAVNEPAFKDSAQFMLELDNGAGVIADVSYASPNSFSYSLPTYWMFNIWGSGGMVKFQGGSDAVEAYFEGAKEAEVIKYPAPKENYITDIIDEINGTGAPVITTSDVIESAHHALLIQKSAE